MKEQIKESAPVIEVPVTVATEAAISSSQPVLLNETGTVPSVIEQAQQAGFSNAFQALELSEDTMNVATTEITTEKTSEQDKTQEITTSFVEPSNSGEWVEVKKTQKTEKPTIVETEVPAPISSEKQQTEVTYKIADPSLVEKKEGAEWPQEAIVKNLPPAWKDPKKVKQIEDSLLKEQHPEEFTTGSEATVQRK